MSSFTTDWSTTTDPVSNTTKEHMEKKRQRRRFMAFTSALMKFLERKDPNVFDEAQAVIRDCEQKKKRGEAGFESVTASLRTPLKQVVGPTYWKRARVYLRKSATHQSKQAVDPSPPTEESTSFSRSDVACLEQRLPLEKGPCSHFASFPLSSTNSYRSITEEQKIRRERFWMLIRVLMKYVENKDHALYLEAKASIKDCVRRNRKREEGYESLSRSVQASVKQVVGTVYWRRAASYLSKLLIEKADEEDLNEMLEEENCQFPHPAMAFGHLSRDDESLQDISPVRPDLEQTLSQTDPWKRHMCNFSEDTSHINTTSSPKRMLEKEAPTPIKQAYSALAKGGSKDGIASDKDVSADCKRRRVHGLNQMN
jgi:hypothetical protein